MLGGRGTGRGNQAVWVISFQTASSTDECKGKLRQGCETLHRDLYQPRQFSTSEGRVHLISGSMVWLCAFFGSLLAQRKSISSLMLEELLHSCIRDTNQDLLYSSVHHVSNPLIHSWWINHILLYELPLLFWRLERISQLFHDLELLEKKLQSVAHFLQAIGS